MVLTTMFCPLPARPQITLSPEQVVEVETLAALLSQEQIADYFDIGRSTFSGDLRARRGSTRPV